MRICEKNVITQKLGNLNYDSQCDCLFFGWCCGKNDIFLPAKLAARGQYMSLLHQAIYKYLIYRNLLSCKIAFLSCDVVLAYTACDIYIFIYIYIYIYINLVPLRGKILEGYSDKPASVVVKMWCYNTSKTANKVLSFLPCPFPLASFCGYLLSF